LAFALPIILIIIVALVTYLPSVGLSTAYNFLYSVCTDGNNYYYDCHRYLGQRYSVVAGQLTVNEVDPLQDFDRDNIPDVNEAFTARIFLHDTAANVSREIDLAEAQGLKLNNLLTSPDGVTVSNEYRRGAEFFPLFDGGSSYGFYLTKGKKGSRLNLINDDRGYYPNNFQFIGWILPN